KLLFILQIRETSARGFKRPRRIGISANLEWVFAFQLEQSADLLQNLRDLCFSHSTYAYRRFCPGRHEVLGVGWLWKSATSTSVIIFLTTCGVPRLWLTSVGAAGGF